jgi:hypothetical protein
VIQKLIFVSQIGEPSWYWMRIKIKNESRWDLMRRGRRPPTEQLAKVFVPPPVIEGELRAAFLRTENDVLLNYGKA